MPLLPAQRHLRRNADPERAKHSLRFFKADPGEYAEGDRFLGVTVPDLRAVARQHRALPRPQIKALLGSRWHEDRLLALVILVAQHQRAMPAEQLRLARAYLAWRGRVNNWDLVDSSAPYLLGPHLDELPANLLPSLARSKNLWDRRIAILATQHEIRRRDYRRALAIARLLKNDEEDLIHKAVGWMLREIGNRDLATLEGFLARHYASMPRTMLRYAIEKFPPNRRRAYLEGTI